MLNKEYLDISQKIDKGLELAEKRMLEEKARNDEDVIVCDDDNIIRHIPAKNFL